MKKQFTLILSVLLVGVCLIGLVGCGNDIRTMPATERDSYDSEYDYQFYDSLYNEEESMEWELNSHSSNVAYDTDTTGSGEMFNDTTDTTTYNDTQSNDSNSEVAGANEPDRKVIRNAYISVEAAKEQDAAELYKQFVEYCNSLGGHEFSGDMSHYDNYSTVNSVLKLPPEKLEAFIQYVDETAKITNSRIDSDDVTSEYYDLTLRLESKRKSLETYYKLLENLDNLDDVLTLQRTIDRIIEDIEATEGRLRVMNSLVNMATVTLRIHHVSDPEVERREVDWGALELDDMGYFIKTGFVTVVNTIAGLFQWVIIILAVTSPFWVPVGILVTVLIVRSKKKKKLRLQEVNRLEQEYKNSKKESERDENE